MEIKLAQNSDRIPPQLLADLEKKGRTEFSNLKTIYYAIDMWTDTWIGVAGDGDNAAYEWFVWRKDGLKTSNAGYGWTEAALRDVLIKETK